MSELKSCPFCENMPLLDEETWVMPGCPCFPRFTKIHVKIWNCRPPSDEARLREAKVWAFERAKTVLGCDCEGGRKQMAYPTHHAICIKSMLDREIAYLSLPSSPSAEPCCRLFPSGHEADCCVGANCKPAPAAEPSKYCQDGHKDHHLCQPAPSPEKL